MACDDLLTACCKCIILYALDTRQQRCQADRFVTPFPGNSCIKQQKRSCGLDKSGPGTQHVTDRHRARLVAPNATHENVQDQMESQLLAPA